MPPRAFDLLVLLVERRGHLIEKDELLKTVWHGSFVEEGNLSVAVSVLRKALNDDRGQHKYIETVSKRGYRFVAERFAKVVNWKRRRLRRNPKILRDRSRIVRRRRTPTGSPPVSPSSVFRSCSLGYSGDGSDIAGMASSSKHFLGRRPKP